MWRTELAKMIIPKENYGFELDTTGPCCHKILQCPNHNYSEIESLYPWFILHEDYRNNFNIWENRRDFFIWVTWPTENEMFTVQKLMLFIFNRHLKYVKKKPVLQTLLDPLLHFPDNVCNSNSAFMCMHCYYYELLLFFALD